MRACVTGATGYVGGHVAKLLSDRGDEVRITYRDERRLERLAGLAVEPVSADVLDRSSLRRAVRGCELVFHTAGYVGSHPRDRLWEMNALAPRRATNTVSGPGPRRAAPGPGARLTPRRRE